MPIKFSLPIRHGGDCLHTMLLPQRRWTPHPTRIAIGTLNVRDGRGFGLAQAIWEVEHGGFGLMLSTETKSRWRRNPTTRWATA